MSNNDGVVGEANFEQRKKFDAELKEIALRELRAGRPKLEAPPMSAEQAKTLENEITQHNARVLESLLLRDPVDETKKFREAMFNGRATQDAFPMDAPKISAEEAEMVKKNLECFLEENPISLDRNTPLFQRLMTDSAEDAKELLAHISTPLSRAEGAEMVKKEVERQLAAAQTAEKFQRERQKRLADFLAGMEVVDNPGLTDPRDSDSDEDDMPVLEDLMPREERATEEQKRDKSESTLD